MNIRNMIFAFALILGAMYFFNSPVYLKWYYQTIMKKPYPESVENTIKKRERTPEDNGKQNDGSDIKKEENRGKTSSIQMKSPEISEITKTKKTEDTLEGDTLWVETQRLICGISQKGAKIISLRTKEYKYSAKEKRDSCIELIPWYTKNGGANLLIDTVSFDDILFTSPVSEKRIFVKRDDSVKIAFSCIAFNGKKVIKEFMFEGNSYRLGISIRSEAIIGKNLSIGWYCGIDESELSSGLGSSQYLKRKVHLYNEKENDVERIDMKKDGKEERSGFYRWVGITSKYFLVALIPDTLRDEDIVVTGFEDQNEVQKKNKNFNYAIGSKNACTGEQQNYWIYAGPSQINGLMKYNIKLEKVLYDGWKFLWAYKWFPVICEWLLLLLLFLNTVFKDYGIAIIVITIIIKAVTYPMQISSMKSMARMKDLQPKITALRQKYKANPQKLNQETMALYKKEGINPMNPGCLPMFLQMPIFIALFIVLQKAIELRGAPTILVPWIHDLSQPEVVFPLPFPIPLISNIYGNNFAILPVIMAVLTYFQNKMTMKDPSQKAMIYMMPVIMLVMFNNFPSGLVIYWTFSSAFGIIQQWIFTKSFEKSHQIPIKENETKMGKKK